MLQQAISSFSFPLLSLIFSIISVAAQNSNIYVQCSQSSLTSTSPYESNVNSLFTSLVESATVYKFEKFAICPPGYSQNDSVYGLFQCQGDLSSSDCKECVMSSITQLRATCPVSTGGAIQLDGCFVKYDKSSFFGDEDKGEVLKRCGPSVGYNSDALNRIDSALTYLIAGNGLYFRAGEYGSIQGVAQCVQDLSESDCQDCISEACGRVRSECQTSTWGDMYLGKCYIRYVDQVNAGNDGPSDDGDSDSDGTPSSKKRKGGKKKGGKKKGGMKKWLRCTIISTLTAAVLSITFTITVTMNCCNFTIFNNINNALNPMERKKVKEIKKLQKDQAENKKATVENKKAIDENKQEINETQKVAREAEWKAHEAMRNSYYNRSYCHHGCTGHCHHLLAIF